MQYLKSHKILILILLIGLFFRIYKLEIFYPWGHDQDLFAWIAKDIVVDHHFRLIGQETSITGVFIGPLFYYLMALSLAIFNMNPLAAYVPITIISLLTIFSIYWVFTKFFGEKVGLIGAFLYAISPGIILLDRWVVPTQLTNLWCIWYLYVLLSILKGKVPVVITGLLVGLIWHVHVAFIPLLILIPISLWLSKKSGNKIRLITKNIAISIVVLFIFLLPFFAFEARHGFQQVKGLVRATYEDKGEVRGISRLVKVFNISGRSLSGILLLDTNPAFPMEFFIFQPILLFILVFYLYKKKIITKNQIVIFSLWTGIDLLSQYVSKRSIPEYYFANLIVIIFLFFSLFLSNTNFKKNFQLVRIILGIYLLIVSFWFISRPDDAGGYLQKRKAIEYVRDTAKSQSYPCVAINYIEGQPGLPNGYRYLSWFYNLKVITGGNDVPTFSIVTPWAISGNEINAKFGAYGVILPIKKNFNFNACNDTNRQLLPLWGFTN